MQDTAPDGLPPGAWSALRGAHDAYRAGGLPCGAALVGPDGTVVATGRNHAYDPSTGADVLEQSPLAHAELNVLARLPTARDLARDTLWSTQQPCAMCVAAISFCGVGTVRYLAADPAFTGTDDPRAGQVSDPMIDHPELTAWAILANALFLQPAVARGDRARLSRNRRFEPEAVEAAEVVATLGHDDLGSLVDALWTRLTDWADSRRRRVTT